jgi:hypothetical protein
MALAPPFTRENAADNARKAVISREANRYARALALEQAVKRPDVEFEIHRLREAMKHEPVTSQLYGELVKRLDLLWNKAFPTQAAVRSRPNRRSQESLGAAPTPQPVVGKPSDNSQKPVSG